VGENVSGLINWSGGVVFDEVQTELEAEGYEVRAFVLPAASVDAPHRRDRVWFVAYANDITHTESQPSEWVQSEQRITGKAEKRQFGGSGSWVGDGAATDTPSNRRQRQRQGIEAQKGLQPQSESTWKLAGGFKGFCGDRIAAYANFKPFNGSDGRGNSKTTSKPRQEAGEFDRVNSNDATNSSNTRLQRSEEQGSAGGIGQKPHEQPAGCVRPNWDKFPTESAICSRNDGLSDRLDRITFSKWRTESIKAYGNAIVPQVALQIFESINEYESEL
jgi:DNA (cytosine-5)-methyltransferase 1